MNPTRKNELLKEYGQKLEVLDQKIFAITQWLAGNVRNPDWMEQARKRTILLRQHEDLLLKRNRVRNNESPLEHGPTTMRVDHPSFTNK